MPDDSGTVAAQMMRLFAGQDRAHGTHSTPALKGNKWAISDPGNAKTLAEPVTLKLWEMHLKGKRPLGVIPIMDDNMCWWGSIDIDDYVNDLMIIIDRVEKARLPLIPCRSKSGGLHLFMFLKEPAFAKTMQTVLKNIAAVLGVAKSEVFPKQTEILADRGDLGNWMVMPYFGGTYDGKLREQVGLRKTGAELTIDQFLRDAETARIDPKDLQQWVNISTATSIRQVEKKRIGTNGHSPSGEAFADGPVCLQILAKLKVEAGGQSNALLNMGMYYKRSDPQQWKVRLENAAREYLDPPGTAEGLISIIRSIEKKDYRYTCKTEPICSHCNASLCRTRKHGIGEETDFPAISGLSKLDIEPPIWFVDVDDKRLEILTDDILYYNRFVKVCFDQGKAYSLMPQAIWMNVLRPLMDNCTVIEAPEELGRGGHFRELLEEFCTNRQKGRNKEDLLIGRPWEDEDDTVGLGKNHYFQLKDFQRFLVKEGVKDYTRGQITQRVKHLGGDHKFFNVKGKGFNAWYVPSEIFTPHPVPDAPKMEGDEI